MRSQALLLTLFFCLPFAFAQSQGVGISPTNATPDPSAALDINFTNKGFLLPRMTETQRGQIGSPAVGLQIYNTTTNCINMWSGSYWTQSCFDCAFQIVVSNDGPSCAGGTVHLSVSTVPGATYSWTGPVGFTSNLQNPVLTNVSTSADGTYSVAVSANGCIAKPVSTIVSVSVPPATPNAIIGATTSCLSTGGFGYFIYPVAGASSYNWTVPGDATINSGQGTDSIGVTFGTVVDYIKVSASNFCGTSQEQSTGPINLGPAPAPNFNYSPAPAIVNTAVNFSPSPITNNTTYSWSFQSGSPGSSTSQSPSVTWTAPGTYNTTFAATNNYCTIPVTGPVNIISSLPAHGSQTFNAFAGLQTFVVPSGITSVTIQAFGAQGGTHTGQGATDPNGEAGGKGASISGTFAVTPGQSLTVIAGQEGLDDAGAGPNNSGAGGGGGSFAYSSGPTLLIAAGGGGGGALQDDGAPQDQGAVGQTSTCGSANKTCTSGGCSGANGSGNLSGKGWNSIMSNAAGNGSFGGYGGGGTTGNHGGGGGGGYSGGGGNTSQNGCGSQYYGDGGGGGGSYNTGSSQSNTAGANSGDGKVIIIW